MTDLTPEIFAKHGLRPDIIFDVGAYDCWSANQYKRWFPDALVVAFEASVKNFLERCLYNCQEIHLFHMAVGPTDGRTAFHDTDGEFLGSGSIYPPNREKLQALHAGMEFLPAYQVPCLRLETFCARYGVVPDFLHIDAQGADLDIVRSLGPLRPKAIFMETSECGDYLGAPETVQELFAAMTGLGYTPVEYLPSDSLFLYQGASPCA